MKTKFDENILKDTKDITVSENLRYMYYLL